MVDQTLTTAMIAVQGPKAVELCRGLIEADASQLRLLLRHADALPRQGLRRQPHRLHRRGRRRVHGGGRPGAWRCGKSWSARGASRAASGARDTLRLEAAMPLYGHELNEEIDPFQAGLGWAVKLDKGDFIGRDALLAAQGRPGPAAARRPGTGRQAHRPRRGRRSFDGRRHGVGRVTSGTFSPTLERADRDGLRRSGADRGRHGV